MEDGEEGVAEGVGKEVEGGEVEGRAGNTVNVRRMGVEMCVSTWGIRKYMWED